MSDSDPPLSSAPPTLEYAGGKAGARMSRLAILAVILAVVGSPFVLAPLLRWVDAAVWDVLQVSLSWRFRRVVVKTGMLVASVAPVVAIVHISFSRGRRRGMSVAVAALIISLIWWALVGLGLIFLSWPGMARR